MLNKEFNKLKYRIQRFKHGYSDLDVDNIEYWFTSIVPEMLLKFKTRVSSPPEDLDMDEWTEFIEVMAQSFKDYNSDTIYDNEYKEEYLKVLKNKLSDDYKPTYEDYTIENKYGSREIEIDSHRKMMLGQGLSLFSKYFDYLTKDNK